MRLLARTTPLLAAFVLLAILRPTAGAEPVMGEYEGEYTPADGAAMKAEADVIGVDKREWRVLLRAGPDQGDPTVAMELKAKRHGKILSIFLGKKTRIKGKVDGVKWRGRIEAGRLMARPKKQKSDAFSLKRVVRHSPTEGMQPPEGAVALLPFKPGERTTLEHWTNQDWRILDDGSVAVHGGESRTRREFGDCALHVEFRLPYEPERRGQGRGNSGVYLQNLYEIQVLDSFGFGPGKGDCGAIYSIAAPRVNPSFPPEQWQTYDITFDAPRFDADGNVSRPARMTVLHNGVMIHKNQDVPRCTEGPGRKLVEKGPVKLQDHGHPVRYRNIWLLEARD